MEAYPLPEVDKAQHEMRGADFASIFKLTQLFQGHGAAVCSPVGADVGDLVGACVVDATQVLGQTPAVPLVRTFAVLPVRSLQSC